MLKRHPLYKWFLLLLDIAVLNFSAYFTIKLRNWMLITGGYPEANYWISFLFLITFGLIFIPIFRYNNLYKRSIFTTKNKQLVFLTRSLFHGSIWLIIAVFFIKWPLLKHSRSILLIFIVSFFVYLSLTRILIFRNIFKRIIKRDVFRRNILVIGAGEAGQMLAAQVESDTDLGLNIVGFIDDDASKKDFRIFNKPVVGSVKDITQEMLSSLQIQEIFIAINFISYEALLNIIKYCRKFKLPVSLTSEHFDVVKHNLKIAELDELSYAYFRSYTGTSIFYNIFKRIFEFIFALALLIIFFPFLLLTAILIKIVSPGPIFYKPIMVGLAGRKFRMYKFRSMHANCDQNPHQELLKDIITNGEMNGEKLKNDSRITSVGRFLRKHSLDELPQLLNILLGQMSLVGPRPCIPYEYKLYKSWQKRRFLVKPGMTGLWQVYGRSKVSFNDMVILDLYYIRNRSIWMDYSIILRTFPVIMFGVGGG